MSASLSSQDALRAWPPPDRWLKRLAVLGAVIGIAMSAAWVAWNREAHRRLQARLDAIAARGEPAEASQLRRAQPLDERDNAALQFRHAASLVDRIALVPAASMLNYSGDPPFPRAWHRMMDKAIVADAAALAAARAARPMRDADWGDDQTFGPAGLTIRHLNPARNLANLLGDAALYAQIQGDDFEAIERIRDVRHLSRALMARPLLLDYLVGMGVEALAMHRLEIIASDLKIQSNADATPSGARPATTDQVQTLIAELLDERLNDDLHRALVMERLWLTETIQSLTRKIRVLRPMVLLDLARLLADFDVVLAATTQPTAPAAQAMIAPLPPAPMQSSKPIAAMTTLVHFASLSLSLSYERPIEHEMRIRAERRMAAVSLAAQLFRRDHGRWPASLAELTPAYLPAVPSDPFTVDAKPLGYVVFHGNPANGDDRPMVYHTAEGRDDFALDGVGPPAIPSFGWNGKTIDQFRDLSRWAPRAATQPAVGAAPSTQADDHEADESDEPGNEPQADDGGKLPSDRKDDQH